MLLTLSAVESCVYSNLVQVAISVHLYLNWQFKTKFQSRRTAAWLSGVRVVLRGGDACDYNLSPVVLSSADIHNLIYERGGVALCCPCKKIAVLTHKLQFTELKQLSCIASILILLSYGLVAFEIQLLPVFLALVLIAKSHCHWSSEYVWLCTANLLASGTIQHTLTGQHLKDNHVCCDELDFFNLDVLF